VQLVVARPGFGRRTSSSRKSARLSARPPCPQVLRPTAARR